MTPLVSILIPAYNSERWIADTIRSALAQTWPRREIIIVDDGSRDRTLAVARRFASREVAVLTHANQGAAAARNKAWSVCQGDYIQWLDADDLLAPDKIHRQLAATDASPDSRTLLSGEWGYFIYRPYKARFVASPLWCDLSPLEFLIRKLGQNLSMQTSVWLVSRALTEAAGPWDTRLLGDDDGEYFCRVALAATEIRFVPSARVYYRRVPGSLSYIGGSRRKLEAQLLALQLYLGYLRSLEDSPRTREAGLRLLETWLVFFYPEWPDMVATLRQEAALLGGTLPEPTLSWKYAWLQRVLGWPAAKRAQVSYNRCKSRMAGVADRLLLALDGGRGRGMATESMRVPAAGTHAAQRHQHS